MRPRLYDIILSGLTALMLAVLTGCERREIVCLDGKAIPLQVAFEWDNAPEARPAGMTLYFYPRDGAGSWRFDIAGSDGGRFELPVGRYQMIAVNNDLPGVRIEGYGSYTSITAATQLLENGATHEMPPVRPTGILYGGVVNEIEVTICGVSYRGSDGMLKECPRGLIRCSPDLLTKEYHVIFRNARGLDRMESARGVLYGMATELRLCDDTPGPGACCVAFPLDSIRGANGVLRGFTSGFGAPERGGVVHCRYSLETTVKLKNGKTYSKTYEVSDIVENFLHENTIVIIIDGLDIPDDPTDEVGDDGFDVGVSGWNTVEIDL